MTWEDSLRLRNRQRYTEGNSTETTSGWLQRHAAASNWTSYGVRAYLWSLHDRLAAVVQSECSSVADSSSDQRVTDADNDQRDCVTRDKNGRQEVVTLHVVRRPVLHADVLDVLCVETGNRCRSDVRSVSGRHWEIFLTLELSVEYRPRRHYRRCERPYQHDYDSRHFSSHVTPQTVTDRQIPTEQCHARLTARSLLRLR